ncbi:MAG: hypothetical protein IJR85_11020 [Synergistaceae bacterium]|nr:hypothetical protein [Synergistaceae bacterium]
MKKFAAVSVGCLFAVLLGCLCARADVPIDAENFPDSTFRGYVMLKFDADSNNILSTEEASSVDFIIDLPGLNIESLKGIENFPNLQALDCSLNQLETLDVSKNTSLRILHCYNNNLSSLILGTESAINILHCYDNRLGALDVSGCPELMELSCYSNDLQAIDVNSNSILTELLCQNNRLEAIDVRDNRVLKMLACYNNQITELDTSRNPLLERLLCDNNRITTLDLSRNTSMDIISCCDNRITSLTLGEKPSLETLYCYSNEIPELDLSRCPKLADFWCGTNQLKAIDVSENKELAVFTCYNNSLKELNVANNPLLQTLMCFENKITELDVTNNPLLDTLACANNPISVLNLSANPELISLHCEGCLLTELDVSRSTNLLELVCTFNLLQELDLSSNSSLLILDCASNDIAALDLKNNSELLTLSCDNDFETLYVVPSGRNDYPYAMNLAEYVGGSLENVETLSAYDSTGQEIASLVSGSDALFAARPHHVVYQYNTGYTGAAVSGTMNVFIGMPSLHFYVPARGSFWYANTPLDDGLVSALTKAFPGATARTFHSIITSEAWTPSESELDGVGSGRNILFKLPEVRPAAEGVYVLMCVFGNDVSVGDGISVQSLEGSAEYVFLDEAYREITSVPESMQAYLAVKLPAGQVNRSVVTVPSGGSSANEEASSGGSSGGCEAGFGLAALLAICAFTKKKRFFAVLGLVLIAASCAQAGVNTSDYRLRIPLEIYTPAGRCTTDFTLTPELAEKVAAEWPNWARKGDDVTAGDVHSFADIALPGTWNFTPADCEILAQTGAYGAALLPITESGTGDGVYVVQCTFSNDVQPGEQIEMLGMSIDINARENLVVHLVTQEYTSDEFGGGTFVVLDENLNRIYSVPANRRVYIATSLTGTNTGVITVVRGRYVKDTDPLSRINPALAQLIADDFGIDVSELKYLTQEGLGDPREPTEAMKQYFASNDREVILNLPTVSVDTSYKAVYFTYTLPDDVWAEVQGKGFDDYVIEALNDSEVSGAGQVRSSFILNGVVSLWELSGGKLDKFGVKEFVFAGLLNSGTPFSIYLTKLIIALLMGGCSSRINPSIIPAVILALIAFKFPRKH